MAVDKNRLNILGTPDMRAISNIDDIKTYINSFTEYDQELMDTIDIMIERLEPLMVENKDELLEFLKMKKQTMTETRSDKDIIEDLRELNPDFKNLDIVNSSKYHNDNGRDLEYIMYKQPNGEVEVLVAAYGCKLNDYIEKHADHLESLTAKEVFDYLKNYINVQLRFYKQDEIERNPSLVRGAVVVDEQIIKSEVEEVQKYLDKHNIKGDIEQAVDNYGERLFRVKDFIFKFETIGGVRKMNVMRQPKNAIKYESETNMSIANDDVETIEQVEITYDDEDKDYDYQDVVPETVSEANMAHYIELTEARELNNYEYTAEDLEFMNSLVKEIVEEMYAGTLEPSTETQARLIIDDYMLDHEARYFAQLEGQQLDEPLSDMEMELIARYQEVKPMMMEKKDVKKLELKNNDKMNEDNKIGAVNFIVLLEMLIIVLYLMGFIYLVKR